MRRVVDSTPPRSRYWRREARLIRRSLREFLAAHHHYGGWSIRALADLCGISKSSVHRMIHRTTRRDSLRTAQRFGLVKLDLGDLSLSNALSVAVDLADVGTDTQTRLLDLDE